MNPKLILFDIDGTLIRHTTSHLTGSWPRFIYAAKKVYGIDVIVPDGKTNFNGMVDKQILYHTLRQKGISREEYNRKFPEVIKALHEHALMQSKTGNQYYEAIPEAVGLVRKLSADKSFIVGILTGNVLPMAHWKIEHTKINPDFFRIYLTGDEYEDRLSLARSVFDAADAKFNIKFKGKDIVIIGDALGDIKCAKEIGANVIITMTGGHSTRAELEAANPDLIVDKLDDPAVYKFLGLK